MIKGMGERLGKVYFLKDFEEFREKYPFMCIKDTSSDLDKTIAMSRFPSEIKQNLYLGTMMNVVDKKEVHLNLLGIKTIIYFTPGKFEELEGKYNCIHHEVQQNERPLLDIETVCDYIINELQTKENTPILVFCINGVISSAVCTRVMLRTNKAWSKEIALAYIMNKRYEAKDMPSWLFSQIVVGEVKKPPKEQELAN
mmetsp:Transcript_33222/g.32322  ORF Transcript_33222/g.32322 Transcript_33222/m.32322 type:complete len:198 (+) Transcript_33222:384-977(+)